MNSVLSVECVDMKECQPFEPPKSDDVTIQMCGCLMPAVAGIPHVSYLVN